MGVHSLCAVEGGMMLVHRILCAVSLGVYSLCAVEEGMMLVHSILCVASLGVHSLCAVEEGMMLLHSQIRSERARQRREPHHLSNEEPVDWSQYIQWKAGKG